jgi:hypothetical protein
VPIRKAYPTRFEPVGLTDGVDQAGTFHGACQTLANLVFDRINRKAVVPRPGVNVENNYSAFVSSQALTVGSISVSLTIGTQIFGMIAALTGTLAGYDVPFVYNTANQTFTTITGQTTANLPTTQATTGAWTPPTMDQCGNKIAVTHPGFSGANYFGWFDTTTPSAPIWTAGNTSVNALPAKPNWVRTFTNRFYFGVANNVVFADAPANWVAGEITISNANFASALTIGDGSSTVAGYFIPIKTSSAGTLQGLLVFKALTIWQITGDIGTSNLALNEVSSTEGTSAPRTIQSLPQGVSYMAANGIRILDVTNQISPLNLDVVAPFTECTVPSRACASYNNGIYRICLTTVVKGVSFTADYWFDNIFSRWNGPHTFPYNIIVSLGQKFYFGSLSYPGILFNSDPFPISTSTFTDNSANYLCTMLTASMPDGSEGTPHPMSEKQIVESTIELSTTTSNSTYFFNAQDDQSNTLASASVAIQTTAPQWGTAVWGAFQWAASVVSSHVFVIPWPNPIVYKKLLMGITVQAAQGVSIKALDMRVQDTGYTLK